MIVAAVAGQLFASQNADESFFTISGVLRRVGKSTTIDFVQKGLSGQIMVNAVSTLKCRSQQL
jgi:hypothetical protein